MDIKHPSKDKHGSEFNDLIEHLTKGLTNVNKVKSKMVNYQKFEQAGELRDVEKYLELSIEELTSIVRKHYT